MLSIKENFLETIKIGGKPDRLVNCYEYMGLVMSPAFLAEHHNAKRGETAKDAFGVTWKWNEDQPAAAPWHTPDNLIVEDITEWKTSFEFPVIDDIDWSPFVAAKEQALKDGLLATAFFPTGLFERLHMLLGFEGALIALMTEPEAFGELAEAIGKYRMHHAELIIENLHPEAVLVHDDWGMKTNLFMQPDLWRKFIKPHYAELVKYFKDNGAIVVHHADSFLEPIVEDMAEIGIDVWQGTLPQNDISRLQKELAGRMTLMGGIDAAIVDTGKAPESLIRSEVRKACEDFGPAGFFIPCFTYGGPFDVIYDGVQDTIMDEINQYNKEVYGVSS
ncbi:MAG: uroporphyrinogen decarboxylase (URO-D) [Clostridiales Family XIII bacterium]|jgi:hypothetical protein|nr:uroporphyrinogen decarboxylase (URO-D) [Clostridiales Family XIII bacterium]